MSEWKKVKLGEICEIYAGGDKPKIFCNYQTDECKVPVYSNGIDNDGLYGFTDIPRNKQYIEWTKAKLDYRNNRITTEKYEEIIC